MTFEQFIAWSASARERAPSAQAYCETRIARALAHLLPNLGDPARAPRVHRCDLVQLWCQRKGLAPSARTALASEGVRHSLQTIFTLLAQEGATVALPRDVYPVYWQLAARSQLSTFGFDTFPTVDLAHILECADKAGAQYLLLPQPLKLHGRAFMPQEADLVHAWLAGAPQRRLILDAVYAFGAPVDPLTQRLLHTDQVIFLDSLSKGYLHAQVFGIALVPERDVQRYTGAFRALTTTPVKLATAYRLLEQFSDLPTQVTSELAARRAALLKLALQTNHRVIAPDQGYLVAIECAAEELLAEHALLTLPASVFGSRCADWSLASALPQT
jgi:DNA-binding transcriptional MocR family regulator